MIYWIDAAAFVQRGGWKLDTQFVLQMGQGYLLAAQKPGQPVENARTYVTTAAPGRYRLWARTKNWLKEYRPGLFQTAIDGQVCSATLGGAPTESWVWEIAGDFELKSGEHTLELIDRTGYYARCAALILTDDFDFTPPQPAERVRALRAEILGLSTASAPGGSYDVIVVGGGPGGVPAAVAAARSGQNTLLLTSRPVLGGNASTEAGVGFDGASSRQPHSREGGIAEELRRIRDHYGYTWEQALNALVENQINLTIIKDSVLVDAETVNSRIQSVTVRHTTSLEDTRYTARMFIDCTGDAWLGFFSGARYRVGREAAWQYAETLAPEAADSVTMSGCLMGGTVGFKAVDTGAPLPYAAPEWRYRFPPGREWNRFVTGVHGHWWLEHPGDRDDLFEAEAARDELMRISLSFFAWLKNDWDEKERAANYDIVTIPIYDAKRENRRLIGDYVLSEQDCFTGKKFEDTIGHTGWTIDVHHPLGVFSGKEGPFHANMHIPRVNLPYRCLYSKNIENLLMAGRNISVTHVALGTVRVQNSIAVAAQAAGTAAAIANKYETTPRGVYEYHLEELQQTLLREDQFIPGLQNNDPKDLARCARVTASSTSSGEPFADQQGVPGEWIELITARAGMLPREMDERIEKVWLYLRNEGPRAFVTAHFRKERDPGLFWAHEDIAANTQELPEGYEGWVAFDVDAAFEERYLWLYLEPAPGVSWRCLDMAPLDWFKAYETSGEFVVDGRWGMMIRFAPPVDVLADCSAEQAVNGYGRIASPNEYMWVSEGLPADLTLTWERDIYPHAIYITLDTDMNNPPMTFPQIPVHPNCLTDFTVEAQVDGEWRLLAEIHGNYQRRAPLSIKPAKTRALRIHALKTGGNPNARILEVRVYGDDQ